jgi:glycosyltransferase involved in cell wall biosynthesis
MDPLVSVIIPAYNTAPFIAETLDSVFEQSFRNFEVIVINDGSPDSAELEQVLVRYRKRIRYFEQANRGVAGAKNTGIRDARGRYLAFLDSDDCWLPDYLLSQMKMFENCLSTDVVYCDAYHFGRPDLVGKTYMQTCPSNGPATLGTLIAGDCQVIASCTVALKQAVVDAGLFDETLDRCEDYDLWLRILYRGGQMSYHRKVLGKYRTRTDSLTRDSMKMSEALIAVYEKASRTMDLSWETRATLENRIREAQAHFDLEAGRNFLDAGDFKRARDALTKANSFFQRRKLKMTILGLQVAPHWTRLASRFWQRAMVGRGTVSS